MIRIVHVMTRTNIGGPSVMLVDLLRGLDPSRYEQIVIRGASPENEGDYLEHHCVANTVITHDELQRAPGVIREVRSLITLTRSLRRIRPDIVHTHMAKAGVVGRLAAVLARVPNRVHTFHGHLLHGYFSKPLSRVVSMVERALRRVTTFSFVVGSRTHADLLRERVVTPTTSKAIVPGARPIAPHDRTDAREHLGLPPDGVVVGFVGRLTQIKRPDRLLRIAREVPDAHFLIVGNGPLRRQVQEETRHMTNVTLTDWTNDLMLILAAVDIIVLTSDNEGVPLLIIEAATAGVPVVSLDVGSISDVVVHETTGLLASDERSLVTGLRTLVTDHAERQAMGVRAQHEIWQRCGMSDYLVHHADLYERLHRRQQA